METKALYITSFVNAKSGKVGQNGKWLLQSTQTDVDIFLTDWYDVLRISYSKFYKMDRLSKLSLLSVESLLQGRQLISTYQPDEIAVVLCSQFASLDADFQFAKTMDTIPSPALFVYTLPNIAIGEVSIRNRWNGENACFIVDKSDGDFLYQYVTSLFEEQACKACICGWVDVFEGSYHADLFLVEETQTKDQILFFPQQINYFTHDGQK